ncbi:MAG TPA: PDZ domain-containing protein [Chthoniobacterales bacterium]
MKTKTILSLAITLFLGASAFAQPPVPPVPPNPPPPPNPPDHRDKMPKVPVTFLGVETSDVPRVVSEQLGLAKGFGLVVDYVVPDGPAAAAGVQQNDILKMLNDQILTEPDQLSKLIRSYSEGTTITLTVLRKGQEQKIPVKLTKKDVPQRRSEGGHMRGDFKMGDMDMDMDTGMNMEGVRDWANDLKEHVTSANKDMVREMVTKAHEQMARAREQALQAGERARQQAERIREQAERIREATRSADGRIKFTRSNDAGLTTTRIDLARAQIVFSDDKGELRLENNDGRRILTAKDPQGRLLFSGPVETPEDMAKLPAEVRDRYTKLQQHDLPSVASPAENNEDEDESEEMDDGESDEPSVEQISTPASLSQMFTI